MTDKGKEESRGRQGKAKRGKTKRKAKGKPKPKGPSYRGTTKKAREQSPEAIDPKVAIIAKDPLRAEIVAVAIQRLYSPSEFAVDKGISVGVAAYAFRVLREHKILELAKTIKVRGALKHMYRANEAAFIGDQDWGALAQVLRPGVIGATIGNFNGRVAQSEETGKLYERDDVCIYWAPRDLDGAAWAEHVTAVNWCIEESDRLEAETAERRANGESDGCIKATFGVFLFPSPTHSEVKAHEKERRRKEREAKQAEAKQAEQRERKAGAARKRRGASRKEGKGGGRARGRKG